MSRITRIVPSIVAPHRLRCGEGRSRGCQSFAATTFLSRQGSRAAVLGLFAGLRQAHLGEHARFKPAEIKSRVGISFRRPKIVALEGGTGGPDIELGARARSSSRNGRVRPATVSQPPRLPR